MAQTLKHSPAEIVRKLLLDLGLGVAAAWTAGKYTGSPWPVFDAGMPDAPDNAIAITDTQGRGFGYSQPTPEALGFGGFQVMVRAKDHRTGWLRADAIYRGFLGVVNLVVALPGDDAASYEVNGIPDIGDVLPIGTEQSTKRHLFTINCTLDAELIS